MADRKPLYNEFDVATWNMKSDSDFPLKSQVPTFQINNTSTVRDTDTVELFSLLGPFLFYAGTERSISLESASVSSAL